MTKILPFLGHVAAATAFASCLTTAYAQSPAPQLPRWTYSDEVSFYKPLKDNCEAYHPDIPGFLGGQIAMRTCSSEYQKLWSDIEATTAQSDRWIIFQWIGDSGNSGGAYIRLIYRERGKKDWAYFDRGERGKEPRTLESRPISAAIAEPLFASIEKNNRIDDPELPSPHASAAYFSIYDGERVYRKAYMPNALSIFSPEEFAKLEALTAAILRLRPVR